MNGIIHYEPMPGTTLKEAFDEAKKTIRDTDIVVRVKFNGIVIEIVKETTYANFSNEYTKQQFNREEKFEKEELEKAAKDYAENSFKDEYGWLAGYTCDEAKEWLKQAFIAGYNYKHKSNDNDWKL